MQINNRKKEHEESREKSQEKPPRAVLRDNLPLWTQQLTAVSREPLEFCPHFPDLAALWEAWWRRGNDRPLLLARYVGGPDPEVPQGRLLHLLERPEEWLAAKEQQLTAATWSVDTVPQIRIDIGPVACGAFLGAHLHLSLNEDTGWQEPIIKEWNGSPSFVLDRSNKWSRIVTELADLAGEAARGRYAVCTPDLSGPTDILANLRGSDKLCFDLYDNRKKVIEASDSLVDVWADTYRELYNRILEKGTGVVQWHNIWSNKPYTVPTCDFNALIGEDDFNEVCLPSYEAQAETVGRVSFHLDGPDASRHAPALAESGPITAVQYTPGAGTPSALEKIDMFRLWQQHDKPILVMAPGNEVPELIESLDHRGLALSVDVESEEELNELERCVGAKGRKD